MNRHSLGILYVPMQVYDILFPETRVRNTCIHASIHIYISMYTFTNLNDTYIRACTHARNDIGR